METSAARTVSLPEPRPPGESLPALWRVVPRCNQAANEPVTTREDDAERKAERDVGGEKGLGRGAHHNRLATQPRSHRQRPDQPEEKAEADAEKPAAPAVVRGPHEHAAVERCRRHEEDHRHGSYRPDREASPRRDSGKTSASRGDEQRRHASDDAGEDAGRARPLRWAGEVPVRADEGGDAHRATPCPPAATGSPASWRVHVSRGGVAPSPASNASRLDALRL